MDEPPETPDAATPAEHGVSRTAHARQFVWLGAAAVLVIAVVALIVENTRHVKVGWIFGSSQISLVYLVVFAVVLGWLLGIATSVLLRRRSRRSR